MCFCKNANAHLSMIELGIRPGLRGFTHVQFLKIKCLRINSAFEMTGKLCRTRRMHAIGFKKFLQFRICRAICGAILNCSHKPTYPFAKFTQCKPIRPYNTI